MKDHAFFQILTFNGYQRLPLTEVNLPKCGLLVSFWCRDL